MRHVFTFKDRAQRGRREFEQISDRQTRRSSKVEPGTLIWPSGNYHLVELNLTKIFHGTICEKINASSFLKKFGLFY